MVAKPSSQSGIDNLPIVTGAGCLPSTPLWYDSFTPITATTTSLSNVKTPKQGMIMIKYSRPSTHHQWDSKKKRHNKNQENKTWPSFFIIFLYVSQVKRWKKPISSPFLFGRYTPSTFPPIRFQNPRICRMNCQLSSRTAGLIKPEISGVCGRKESTHLANGPRSFKKFETSSNTAESAWFFGNLWMGKVCKL